MIAHDNYITNVLYLDLYKLVCLSCYKYLYFQYGKYT
jgi:hypothetical protein